MTLEELVAQLPLLIAWALYGVLHSVLAGRKCKQYVVERHPGVAPFYRIAYNLIATALLIPIAYLWHSEPGAMLWRLSGPARYTLDFMVILLVAVLFVRGPGYDLREFLGLRPSAGPARLRISTWHRCVRHPWYLVALIVVWTRDMGIAWLISSVCISAYFLIGSRLEESKLIAVFGDAYRRYRDQVPGLLPYRGFAISEAEALRLEVAASASQRSGDDRSPGHQPSRPDGE